VEPMDNRWKPEIDLSEYIVECTEYYAGLHQDDEEDQC
jgi:hypothetical protein